MKKLGFHLEILAQQISFSTESDAKAQINLGLLPFSLVIVEAFISFPFEESGEDIKDKNGMRKLVI